LNYDPALSTLRIMKKVIIIGAIVAIVGGGLYYFYKQQYSQVTNLDFKFLKVSLGKLAATDTILNISLMVTSNSTLEAKVTDLNLEVYINDKKVGNVSELSPIILPAKGSSVVDLKVAINPLQTGMDILDVAASYFKEKNAVVRINGYGKVKTAFIETSVPFTYDTTLKELIS
jgi:LEA14-like dessication related protein